MHGRAALKRFVGGLIAAIGLICASALSLSPPSRNRRFGNFDFYVLALERWAFPILGILYN